MITIQNLPPNGPVGVLTLRGPDRLGRPRAAVGSDRPGQGHQRLPRRAHLQAGRRGPRRTRPRRPLPSRSRPGRRPISLAMPADVVDASARNPTSRHRRPPPTAPVGPVAAAACAATSTTWPWSEAGLRFLGALPPGPAPLRQLAGRRQGRRPGPGRRDHPGRLPGRAPRRQHPGRHPLPGRQRRPGAGRGAQHRFLVRERLAGADTPLLRPRHP